MSPIIILKEIILEQFLTHVRLSIARMVVAALKHFLPFERLAYLILLLRVFFFLDGLL